MSKLSKFLEGAEYTMGNKGPGMRSVKVHYSNGTSITTSMAAGTSDQAIKDYFKVGKQINVGGPNGTDKMATISNVEILEEMDGVKTPDESVEGMEKELAALRLKASDEKNTGNDKMQQDVRDLEKKINDFKANKFATNTVIPESKATKFLVKYTEDFEDEHGIMSDKDNAKGDCTAPDKNMEDADSDAKNKQAQVDHDKEMAAKRAQYVKDNPIQDKYGRGVPEKTKEEMEDDDEQTSDPSLTSESAKWDAMVAKLKSQGHSKESSDKIAGWIANRKKQAGG